MKSTKVTQRTKNKRKAREEGRERKDHEMRENVGQAKRNGKERNTK